MRMDFRVPGAWAALNDSIAEKLSLDLNRCVVRSYQGVGAALVEVVIGISKLFPLKKKIYYFKNMNPFFDQALLHLAKEGYQVQSLDLSVLNQPQEWAATLGREDLFILYSLDEPFLGRAYDVNLLEDTLKDKNTFKICVSHARHFYEDVSGALKATLPKTTGAFIPDKNKATIYSLAPEQAFAVIGERGRIGALCADQLNLPGIQSWDLSWWQKPQATDSKKIIEFESKKVAGATPVFTAADKRVFDRVVIYWPDLDGHAFIDRLAKKLDFTLLDPGLENRLETTSLSRWGGSKSSDFLKAQGLASEIIRGLVMIDYKLIEGGATEQSQSQPLEKLMAEVRSSILEDQNG